MAEVTIKYMKLVLKSCRKSKVTYINIVYVQNLGVEMKSHGLGLLNGMSELAVCLQTQREPRR